MILSETEIRFENAGTVLKTGLSAISNGDTVIDMKNVRRADSSAVAVVLDWIRSAQKSGQPLHVINRQGSFDKLVRLYGLSGIVRID